MTLLVGFLRSLFLHRETLILENLALRQQLAAYKRTSKRPRLQNHSHEIFACDFMTQYTALFTTVYVFVVMEVSTRRIVHCNVTERPALNHFIFLSASHVRRIAREFIEYYNRARPSQGSKRSLRVHAIPDPYPELTDRPLAGGKLIALPVLGGVQHDYRLAA